MSSISPSGPINPDDQTTYQRQFKESVNLFSDALDKYNEIENPNKTTEFKKKAMFKDVMDKTKHIMEATHTQMQKKEVEQKFQQLQKDYLELGRDEKAAYDKLSQDIQDLRKLVE